jgi:hypothetical protein
MEYEPKLIPSFTDALASRLEKAGKAALFAVG